MHVVMGIYKIESSNGKIYIGSATDIVQRWRHHKHDLRKSRHPNRKLQNAWNKYGELAFTFSIIEIVDCKEDLATIEQIWLNILWDSLEPDDRYNLNKNAINMAGFKMSHETKLKMSQQRKGKPWTEARRLAQKERNI